MVVIPLYAVIGDDVKSHLISCLFWERWSVYTASLFMYQYYISLDLLIYLLNDIDVP